MVPTRETVLGIPTLVFTEADVDLGKALARTLAERPGQLSLTEAADIARREA